MNKTTLTENLNFKPQYQETEYEVRYRQRELIYILKTGEKHLPRPERQHLTHFLLAGNLLHVKEVEISRSKNSKARLSHFNRNVVFVVNKDVLTNELKKIKDVFDNYLSFYRFERIDNPRISYNYDPYKPTNKDNVVVRLHYRRELVRWGVIEQDLLNYYRQDVVKKANGLVKIKNISKTHQKYVQHYR